MFRTRALDNQPDGSWSSMETSAPWPLLYAAPSAMGLKLK